VLLCDVWGVVHDGVRAFPGPCAALARWRAERGPVILISNSPRPRADVAVQLDQLGAPREAWSALVTSGDVTSDLLAGRAPGPAWWIGPARDGALFEGSGLAFSGPDEAAFIACTGLEDDETQTPGDYADALAIAAGRGLEMICANPDRVVQRGDRLIWCAGALAELYETLGGAVLMAGKPFPLIYRRAFAESEVILGRGLEPSRVLVIGDGVATDIGGANRQGLDVLFVAGGIHAADFAEASRDALPLCVAALLAEHGARADFVIDELRWGEASRHGT
jgi:HAD superfamily hydrolase (TIGR01450 family)